MLDLSRKHDRAAELRAIADGRLLLNVRNGVTVSRSMLAMIADEIDALRAAPLAPDEVGGLVEMLRDTYTEWNNPPSDGLPDGAGIMLQAATALEAQAAELAAKNTEIANLREASIRSGNAIAAERAAHAETKRERDEALKALEPFANIEPSTAVAHDGSEAEPYCVYLACRDRFDFTGADLAAARRALASKGGER